MTGSFPVRAAVASDAEALSALARRAKAAWGYDAAFMAACRDELLITPRMVAQDQVRLIEKDGRPVAFFRLTIARERAEVPASFVAPDAMRRRLGTRRKSPAPPVPAPSRSNPTPTRKASIWRWACDGVGHRVPAASPAAVCQR